VPGNRAELLKDGPAAFAAMLAAIRGARRHVNVESFIFDDRGETGRAFVDLLLEKRATGVAVHVIYDSLGSEDTRAEAFSRLAAAGVRLLEVHPLNPLKAWGAPRWTPNRRDHRKLLIVDGRIAFTGGMNVDEVYDKGRSDRWRDTHLRLEGPVVAEFQKLFLAQWHEQSHETLPDAGYFPALSPAGDDTVGLIATSPEDGAPVFHRLVLSAFDAAERSIHVTQAYFAPPPALGAALGRAARRGLDVRLVLPSRSDQPAVVWAGRSHYAALLAAGVRIFERRGVTLHAKTVVVDGTWSVVGSANFDYRSVKFNDEVNALVVGPRFGTAMEAMFTADIAQSEEITAEAWSRRPLASRAKEWLARSVEAWL
jgi:cardiolipin synthase